MSDQRAMLTTCADACTFLQLELGVAPRRAASPSAARSAASPRATRASTSPKRSPVRTCAPARPRRSRPRRAAPKRSSLIDEPLTGDAQSSHCAQKYSHAPSRMTSRKHAIAAPVSRNGRPFRQNCSRRFVAGVSISAGADVSASHSQLSSGARRRAGERAEERGAPLGLARSAAWFLTHSASSSAENAHGTGRSAPVAVHQQREPPPPACARALVARGPPRPRRAASPRLRVGCRARARRRRRRGRARVVAVAPPREQ